MLKTSRKLTWLAIVTWVDSLGRTRYATCQGSLVACLDYGKYYAAEGREVSYSVHASSRSAWSRTYAVCGI